MCICVYVYIRHKLILTFSDSQFTMIHLSDTGFSSDDSFTTKILSDSTPD